jgi:hypothetical protein
MKLSDVTTIKNFFFGLPHAVTVWMLTTFFLSTLLLAYAGGRHWYNNYLYKQHQSYRRDSLMISKLNAITSKVIMIEMAVDNIRKHELLQDEKFNTVGTYIHRIDQNNSNILYEFRKLDNLYNGFISIKAAPDAEKKNQLTQQIIE